MDPALVAFDFTKAGAILADMVESYLAVIWRGCSTIISVDGSTTTAATINQLFTRPCGTSTEYWRDGRIGSSSP